MTKANFPLVALALSLFLMGILVKTGATDPNTTNMLPLLTVLIISEFGCIVCVVAVYLGGQTIIQNGFEIVLAVVTLVCAMLAVEFMLIGIQHWPGG